MGTRNSDKATIARSCARQSLARLAKGKKDAAMVPARCFPGIPGFAKGVVSHWGRTIFFVDDPPFFI